MCRDNFHPRFNYFLDSDSLTFLDDNNAFFYFKILTLICWYVFTHFDFSWKIAEMIREQNLVLKEKDNNSVCLMKKWNCVSNTNKHISVIFLDSREDCS